MALGSCAIARFRCPASRPDRRPQGVVFEVGFAEVYEERVQDAFQWLLMEPGVQLEALLKVDEDRDCCASAPGGRRRIDELMWRLDNKRARTAPPWTYVSSLLPNFHATINITDLRPSQERCDLQVTFDLVEYQRVLEDAIQQLPAGRVFVCRAVSVVAEDVFMWRSHFRE
ncbi:hypothetical protein FN846DRAFT_903480 [Sphaerosporella brunnea]|uniref:Uncharacterized protein n=1 Tax=Sphaerosporella brunnea TaxID=1250544 RepID=A0A5J5F7B4_9PEZI|nr:hypothetical protein FN846DRAFT_903469 [Sphaerosporella brunnea]KAA8912518.1 hypothetical protein FN846DRAFT_903480 [Sphaerosporella brunnea]